MSNTKHLHQKRHTRYIADTFGYPIEMFDFYVLLCRYTKT